MHGISPRWSNLLYGAAMLLAVFVYFFGLDSQHIPKNGDENVYAHITRLTAASGHWLPLQSELDGMRNTKPPALFWQGIASTGHGQNWTLWDLRYPNVIYTLLTAAMVFLLGWKCARSLPDGFVAALTYLAFFSTYRYGRPFLTNAPETFWLFLPFFLLLYRKETAFASNRLPLLLGVAIGIGLLYKSFALLLPVGLGLSWWYLHQRDYRLGDFIRQDVWKLLVVALISLALFGLWFLLDPDPAAVWQEFVMKENAGKFDPAGASYLSKLLWGSSSVWTMILGLPLNAGPLALPVAALMAAALRHRRQLSADEKLLWIWLLAMVIVFSLPSQRSSRYVLAAMPALAVLCALGWERLGRGWFLATLLLCELALVFIAYLSWRLQGATPDGTLYSALYWLLLLLAGGFATAAMLLPALTRPGASIAVLLVFVSAAAFLRPFDSARGSFSIEAQRQVAGKTVWVPSDFNASYEAYRFLLPAANIQSYREKRDQDPDELARRYALFTVRVPLGGHACAGCKVIAERLDLRGRHSSAEISAILHGKIFENIFLKELLVESPSVGAR